MPNIQKVAASSAITDLNRDYVLKQLQAQRAAQLAQALTERGDAPIQYDQRGAISWTQGLAKMLDAYQGKRMTDKAIEQQADVRAQGANIIAEANGKPPGGDQPPAAPPAQPASAQPPAQDFPPDTATGFTPPADKVPAPAPQPTPQALASGLQASNKTQLNPYGAPWMLSMRASEGDPAATENLKTWLKNSELTPEIKNSRDPLIGSSVVENLKTQNMPEIRRLQYARGLLEAGSPQAQQIDEQIRKLNFTAPVEVKAKTLAIDPYTRKPIAYNPGVDDGMNLDFTNPLRPTVQNIGGYTDSVANIETAKRRAINSQTLAPTENQPRNPDGTVKNETVDGVINPGQSPSYKPQAGTTPPSVWNAGPLSDQMLQRYQQAAQGGDRDAQDMLSAYSRSQYGQRPPANPTSRPAGGMPFGQQQLADDNAKTWTTQRQRASQVPGTLSVLGTMDQLLDGFTPGAGADNLAKWKSFASTHGIPIDLKATDAAQEFNKYANQLISQQRSAMGSSATDAAQAVAQAGSANWGIGKDPNRNILQYLKANEMGVDKFTNAKAAYLSEQGNGMHNASDFDRQWNSVYDPRIIMFQNMQPQQKNQFTAELVKSNQYDDFERKLIGYKNLLKRYGQ